MTFLNEQERHSLRAIVQTLTAPADDVPAPLGAYDPTATAALLDDVISGLEYATDEASRRDLRLVLRAFESGALNRLLAGAALPFSHMSQPQREAALRAWAFSRFETRRKAFQAFKRLSLFLAYSNPPSGAHPLWEVIRYPGAVASTAPHHRPIQPLEISADTTLTTEVLVIGSGAGGGVAAGVLATAGREVLIVEKGAYYAESDLTGSERQSTEDMYEKKGALTSADTSMMILAGSTLGGGTTINWAGSLRTPDSVLEEWARDYGFEGATTPEYKASMDAVSQRMNITTDECALNGNNAQLVRGSEALGYPVDVIPRNVKGCEDCGYCNFGCAFGAKQGTLRTYLQDAVDHGARVLVRATVERLTHERGTVTGAVVQAEDADGRLHRVTIRAKIVVVSAGSIHTPAILRRSGLTNYNIGAHLHLHPVTVIFSLFNEPIRTWQGGPMTRVVRQFNNLDGQGYGVVIEVAPGHPGLTASILPWHSARQHKHLLAQMEYLANVIIIARDRHGGRVTIDRHGSPVVHYRLHPHDRAHLQKGVIEALKIHHAAGARQTYSPHNEPMVYQRDTGASFPAFLERVQRRGLKPHAFPLFSAHQMSSCRIAAYPQVGATRPDGQLWELKNCFIVDGSALPTATGVNPMLSILTLAHYLSQGIRERV